jgi:hypothetical protein
LHPRGFNESAALPYGLRVAEIKAAIDDVYDFFYNVNRFLVDKGWDRLEETLSAASFSGMLSEMIVQGVSKRSATVNKNMHHNGRPDLVPRGHYPGDGALHGDEGIEVKASRYSTGWQGHNVESGYLLIVQFYSEKTEPTIIDRVMAAKLDVADWSFSGRGEASRRTPTASVKRSGVEKLAANPVYLDPGYKPRPLPRRRVIVTETEPAEQ